MDGRRRIAPVIAKIAQNCAQLRRIARRTFSRIWIDTSPSAKREIFAGVSGTPRRAEISSASSGLALPARSCRCGRAAPPPSRLVAVESETPSGLRDLKRWRSTSSFPEQNASFSSRFSKSGPSSCPVPRSSSRLSYFFMIFWNPLVLIHTKVCSRPSVRYASK